MHRTGRFVRVSGGATGGHVRRQSSVRFQPGPSLFLPRGSFSAHVVGSAAAACMHAEAASEQSSLCFSLLSFRRAGGIKVQLCGFLQYANIVAVAIGYTIAASISML